MLRRPQGAPPLLPLPLPPAEPGTSSDLALVVEVGVDCDLLGADGDADLGLISVLVDEDDGPDVGPIATSIAIASPLRKLAVRTCG